MKTETIAAIATSLTESGISIIRISGPEAVDVADRVFVAKNGKKVNAFQSHTIHYGHIMDGENILDEVMVSYMKGPYSYTAEDVVEINCHGGVFITKKILTFVLQNGARLAIPGEFTKRAFLNGRIDLSKAEAIMDIIQADNEFALSMGMKQLKGALFEKVKELREKIIYEIAFIESALDDPEHISLDGYQDSLKEKLEVILEDLIHLESTAENGKILKNGIKTVIVGKPNAGKSSFLNLLLGEDKAIVTDIAGTTRDALEEYIKVGEVSLHVIDTAGIRDTDDVVEKIGVSKAINYVKDADLILYVVDSSVDLDENDMEIMKMSSGKKTIVLLNKSDLQPVLKEADVENILLENNHEKDDIRFLSVSAKNKEGFNEFESLIKDMFFHGEIVIKDEVMITNMRQKENIMDTIQSIRLVMDSIEMCMPEDFLTIDLMNGYEALGRIIGEEIGEDLVNEIFSKFCTGK